jgi:hypothetical protein
METRERYAEQMISYAPGTDAMKGSKALAAEHTVHDAVIYDHDIEAFDEHGEECASPVENGSVTSMIYSMVATFLILFLMIKKRKEDEEMIRGCK